MARLTFERILCDRCGVHVDIPYVDHRANPLPKGWVVMQVKGNGPGEIFCGAACTMAALEAVATS